MFTDKFHAPDRTEEKAYLEFAGGKNFSCFQGTAQFIRQDRKEETRKVIIINILKLCWLTFYMIKL